MSDDDFLRVEAHDCPMSSCAAPAGSPCRTGKGKVAIQYHTARFRLVPSLAKALNVPIPALRKPGTPWTELPRPAAAPTESSGHVRIGYARASTVRQSLDAQLDSLRAASVGRIFSEKISTRVLVRPELDRAVALAREIRASGAAVVDEAMLSMALHLRDNGHSLRDIATRLVITKGKKKGQHPSPATVLRLLREHDRTSAPTG